VNSETDFVAKNAEFQAWSPDRPGGALGVAADLEALKAADLDGKTVEVSPTPSPRSART
jgi:elongation factor Ts